MFTFLVQAGVPCKWTNDSQRILLENFDMVFNSPFHLYHTALPFSPSSSWLHEYYTAELLQIFKVVRGLPAEWGMCSRTVLLKSCPWTLSYSNNVVAVGSEDRDILILDAITGSQMAVLPGHTDVVRSLTFSSDGASLVSGSHDKTVKLWDVQTGGVVKTFHGHTSWVNSVSISADYTIIASGSGGMKIYLWDIQTGECHQMMEHQDFVSCVSFSPKNPHLLMSASGDGTVQQWNTNGYKAGPTYSGYQIAFSPDGTDKFISRAEKDITVWSISSGVIVSGFGITISQCHPCCFSPDGTLVAATAGNNAYVWDITGSGPHLVETFVGHTKDITSLAFSSPSTLISASRDKSIKFWQIGALPSDPAVTNLKSPPLTLVPAKSIAPEVKNSIIVPSGLDGVIQTWGISIIPHKEPLQTPAEHSNQGNIQLIDTKLIFVWYADHKINIWDAEEGELLQTIKFSGYRIFGDGVMDFKILGDGSRLFCLYNQGIYAWDIWTGRKVMCETLDHVLGEILAIDGSKFYSGKVRYNPSVVVWDFGTPDSYIAGSPDKLPDRLHLNDTKVWEITTSRMKDVVTGKVVLQLPERFGKVVHMQLGSQYLVASFRSKEVLILDVSHMILQ